MVFLSYAIISNIVLFFPYEYQTGNPERPFLTTFLKTIQTYQRRLPIKLSLLTESQKQHPIGSIQLLLFSSVLSIGKEELASGTTPLIYSKPFYRSKILIMSLSQWKQMKGKNQHCVFPSLFTKQLLPKHLPDCEVY